MPVIKSDLYDLARKAHTLIKATPMVTRVQLNHELKTTFNAKKNEQLTTVLYAMLTRDQIRKRFHLEENRVEFWVSEGSTEQGDPLRSAKVVPDYLKGNPREVAESVIEYGILHLMHEKFWLYSFPAVRAAFPECNDLFLNRAIQSLLVRREIRSATIGASDTVMYWHSDWDDMVSELYKIVPPESEMGVTAPIETNGGKLDVTDASPDALRKIRDGRVATAKKNVRRYFTRADSGEFVLHREGRGKKPIVITSDEYDSIVAFYEENSERHPTRQSLA